MTTATNQLASVPLFDGLSPELINRVAAHARSREYAPGQVIVEEGHEGVGLFIITEGEVRVSQHGREVGTLGPGSVLGEMALLDHHLRSATVTAMAPTRCLVIARWDFIADLRSNPDLVLALLRTLSRRLRELDERLAAV